ncbi:ABC transporter permease [Butyrivibrio sp. LC3010]|uniref:ABC transporter permease n=1 Tax=Butyrivibrio sp. LC3010 TaxID=1280680 RepID=UPI0004019CBF|nr:ABC transporter permease [Butyrivibrio sp. LC3010]
MAKEKTDKLPFISELPKQVGLGIYYGLAVVLMLIVVLHSNQLADQHTELLKKICACILIVMSMILVTAWYDKLMVLPVELFNSRRLIWRLAVNDFKKRYAGSYMGVVWALVQPVVTVLMYWFVFDRIFHTRSQMVAGGIDVPYVLFLTSGLVPWFFFNEALMNGTTSLLEYNYLVKKVLFKISILPLIKVIAALFIHIFFAVVMLVVACMYGYYPTIYTTQIFYYAICEFILVLSVCYTTCAVVVFFRDLTQILAIALQVGQWATPILWDINMLPDNLKWIIKLNPMTYVVNGYRNAVYGDEWFFEHFYSSTYFWIVVVALFCIGSLIFKRSKTHFADVL